MIPFARSIVVASLVSAASCSGGDNPAKGSEAAPPEETVQSKAFALAAGTWDWYDRDSTCLGNTHTLSFSDARDTMIIEFKRPLESMGGRRIFRYKILGVGDSVLPPFTFVIRGAIEGETRRTEKGELAVWDLLLASPNRYHWHRTDWPTDQGTRAILRCEGSTPLEQWRPADSTEPKPKSKAA